MVLPVAASMAHTLLLAEIEYMTPSITIGVACRPCVMVPGWWIHATLSFFTLSRLTWFSGLKRQALLVRWYCGQLFGSSKPGPDWAAAGAENSDIIDAAAMADAISAGRNCLRIGFINQVSIMFLRWRGLRPPPPVLPLLPLRMLRELQIRT